VTDTQTERDTNGRTRLLDTAERLFDEQGIDGVSMRTLTIEAGHRNASAVNYHFGTRVELINAVIERRRVGIESRRAAIVDEIEAAGEVPGRVAIAAVLEPMVDLLDDAGGRRYLRLLFQAAVHPLFVDRTASGFSPTIARVLPYITPLVAHLSPERAATRLRLIMEMALLALAEQSRLLDVAEPARRPLDRATFTSDLLDAITGALQA
jgi:AcrR family transcriptional regulator